MMRMRSVLTSSALLLCVILVSVPSAPQGIRSEGLWLIGAAAWHDRGYDGQGTVVAIWDTGFLGYEQLLSTELPPAERVVGVALDVPLTGDPGGGGTRHGTAIAEVVYDIAPAAALRLLASPADVDPARVEAILLAWRPDVVVISIYGGIACSNAEGAYEQLLRTLWDHGILVVVAAGNDGESYWNGRFSDVNGDGFHDFRSYDDGMSFAVYAGDVVDLYLHWGDPCSPHPDDYDLLLYDGAGTLIASSEQDPAVDGYVERIHSEGLSTGTYFVRIRKAVGAAPVELHLRWMNGRRIEYPTTSGSLRRVLPACSPYALTVGAVNVHTLWLETYSSQGPASEGAIKPELVGPDHVWTATTGPAFQRGGAWVGGFDGTSAAAPHVAGAALLLLQAFPTLGPDALRDLLMAHATDRGPPGIDPQFGAGIVRLPPPPS